MVGWLEVVAKRGFAKARGLLFSVESEQWPTPRLAYSPSLCVYIKILTAAQVAEPATSQSKCHASNSSVKVLCSCRDGLAICVFVFILNVVEGKLGEFLLPNKNVFDVKALIDR